MDKSVKSPWLRTLSNIKGRCENKKVHRYEYYGGRGIKNLLTKEDIKYLWFRDKAYKMKQPSIHRKNHDLSYFVDNCEFIEFSKNRKLRIYKYTRLSNVKYKRLIVDLEKPSIHAAMKAKARAEGKTIREMVTGLLLEWLHSKAKV